MVKITKELLKKRAEHNDGILSSLEEITLHQYNIEKIELIQNHCKHLKILYLPGRAVGGQAKRRRVRTPSCLNPIDTYIVAHNHTICH